MIRFRFSPDEYPTPPAPSFVEDDGGFGVVHATILATVLAIAAAGPVRAAPLFDESMAFAAAPTIAVDDGWFPAGVSIATPVQSAVLFDDASCPSQVLADEGFVLYTADLANTAYTQPILDDGSGPIAVISVDDDGVLVITTRLAEPVTCVVWTPDECAPVVVSVAVDHDSLPFTFTVGAGPSAVAAIAQDEWVPQPATAVVDEDLAPFTFALRSDPSTVSVSATDEWVPGPLVLGYLTADFDLIPLLGADLDLAPLFADDFTLDPEG